MRRSALILAPLVVLASACSTILGDTPVVTSPNTGKGSSTAADGQASTSEPSSPGCIRFTGDHSTPVDTGSVATDALYLSGEAFICADDVVVVGVDDLNEVAAAAQLAAALSGPMLFPDPRLAAELGRLDAHRVHLVGDPEVKVPSGATSVSHDAASAIELARQTLGVDEEKTLPSTPDASTIVDTVLAIEAGDQVAVPGAGPATSTTTSAVPSVEASEIVRGLASPSELSSIWMVDASNPVTILLSAAVGKTLGAGVLAFDGTDVLGYPEVGDALAGRAGGDTRFVGGAPEGAAWELAVLAGGQQVPGGGYHILPRDGKRRYFAFYGHPGTNALGVLGEQGPAETLQRMQSFIKDYGADGSQVVPTFEIIASVASGGPTDDGDYSYEWPPDSFREWIDFARDHDMYVVLDLQSGRDDFLSQAVQYEELLKLPFVGLALDPEWRLTSDQVHLQQVGSAQASEMNEAINWVADLVRDNGLPQKMIVAHQFRTSMIQNRQDLVDRPEIQLIVQMDGDGTEPQKDATWSQILNGADDAHWAWGWKNFFDEDEPGPPSPESTMSKVPTPVYVSYQ